MDPTHKKIQLQRGNSLENATTRTIYYRIFTKWTMIVETPNHNDETCNLLLHLFFSNLYFWRQIGIKIRKQNVQAHTMQGDEAQETKKTSDRIKETEEKRDHQTITSFKKIHYFEKTRALWKSNRKNKDVILAFIFD